MNNSGGSTLTTIAKKQPKINNIRKKCNTTQHKQTTNEPEKKLYDNPVGIWQLAVGGDKNTHTHTHPHMQMQTRKL